MNHARQFGLHNKHLAGAFITATSFFIHLSRDLVIQDLDVYCHIIHNPKTECYLLNINDFPFEHPRILGMLKSHDSYNKKLLVMNQRICNFFFSYEGLEIPIKRGWCFLFDAFQEIQVEDGRAWRARSWTRRSWYSGRHATYWYWPLPAWPPRSSTLTCLAPQPTLPDLAYTVLRFRGFISIPMTRSKIELFFPLTTQAVCVCSPQAWIITSARMIRLILKKLI